MISCERAFYLKNSYPSKNIAAMKLATLVAAALLAVNTILYASDPVKIGDKYYYEDAAGNLILAPEGSVRASLLMAFRYRRGAFPENYALRKR